MSDKPILFSGDMIRALLDGRKMQTRRVVKPQPPQRFCEGDCAAIVNTTRTRWAFSRIGGPNCYKEAWPPDPEPGIACPYGQPGDLLWVRDMPRWALRLTGVRVERVQEITPRDVKAEGVDPIDGGIEWYYGPDSLGFDKPQEAFQHVWEKIHGDGAWEEDPWVWVVEFSRIE